MMNRPPPSALPMINEMESKSLQTLSDKSEALDFSSNDISPDDNGYIQHSSNQTPRSGQREERTKRGRKGHTKSRTGCFNCKRARIKCKENQPACDYCAHRGLHCQWSGLRTQAIQSQEGTRSMIRRSTPAPMEVASIPSSPKTQGPVFTSQDFRLFDYFVKSCYPHHPVGNDSTWTHDIPCIASDHPFLLHAMLALSASELSKYAPSLNGSTTLSTTALSHRVKSIEALNAAVSTGLTSSSQGNAMLATCFALLFQSTFLDDGLGEYMSFIRGTIAIGIQMYMKSFKILFTKLFEDEVMGELDPELQKTPLIEGGVVRGGIRSLERMGPLCQTKVEKEMYALLLSMARNLITSSRDAYLELRKIYARFSYHMPYSEFREFTNPANEVCQLLQAHFVAMQLVMTPISKVEWAGRKQENLQREHEHGQTGHWLINIHSHIPPHMRKYYEWTLWVEDEVYRKKRIFNGKYDGLEPVEIEVM